MHWLTSWFFTVTGSRDEGGPVYGFWSGFGGTVLFSAVILSPAWYWHRTCHVRTCLRPARHPVAGTGIVTCRRHHPVLGQHRRLTAESIRHLHREARQAGQ